MPKQSNLARFEESWDNGLTCEAIFIPREFRITPELLNS
jgi:hypothetical protein